MIHGIAGMGKIRFEYKIVLIYSIIGLLWIYLSDTFFGSLISNKKLLIELSIYKGSVYVLITSLLLFYLVRRQMYRIKMSQLNVEESERTFKTVLESISLIGLVLDDEGNILLCNDFLLGLTGWKREELLHQSEEQLKWLVQDMHVGVLLQGPHAEMLLCNPMALELLGLSEDQLMGKTSFDPDWNVIHEDGSPFPGPTHPVPQVIATHHAVHNIVMGVFRPMTGDRVWLLVDAVPEIRQDGNLEQIVCTFIDISERKKAEAARRESEEKFRRIVESSPVAKYFYHLDAGERLILTGANPSADRIIGINHKELIGRTIEEAFPALAETEIPTMYRKVAQGELGPQSFEIPYTDERFTGFFEVKVFSTGPRDIAVDFIDTTDRKKAELDIAEALNYSRIIFEASPIGLITYKESGETIAANTAAAKIVGATVEQLLKQNFRTLESWRQCGLLNAANAALVSGKEQSIEIHQVSSFGKEVWLSCRLIAIVHHGQQELLGLYTDITEWKITEQILRDVQRRESLGILSSGIAHDFNNLLGSMMGNISLAQAQLPAQLPAVKNIEKALSAMERAAQLTQQMLAYSGKGKFQTRAIDLGGMVRENVNLLKVSLAKNVLLVMELQPTPLYINGDPGQIEQILMNLIMNGGEAIGEKQGTVSVSLVEATMRRDELAKYCEFPNNVLDDGTYAVLTVSDNGIGMSKETLNKIFDPFFTTKFTGRGLGLSAVLGIIQGHKGGLTVESKEGEGTKFKIILPAIAAPVQDEGMQVHREHSHDCVSKSILIIDDERDVASMAQEILETENYSVHVELSPVQGVEFYKDHCSEIDLVMLDLTMPEMSGKEVVEALHAIDPTVKVIITSGYSEEEVTKKIGVVKVLGFIQKPYRLEALLSLVQHVVQ
jgi:PAS domain S-box-containing protein